MTGPDSGPVPALGGLTAAVTIVEVGSGDLSALRAGAALFDAYREHYGRPATPEESWRWLVEQLAGRLQMFLAVPDETVDDACGFVTVTVIPASLALGVWWQARDLWVAPGARRRGIAQALLLHIIAEARAAGALRVGLQTEVDNGPALALYESLGFIGVTGLQQLTLEIAPPGVTD